MGRRIWLLLLVLCGVSAAHAQGTGRINGVVTADGKAVLGATVTVVGLNRNVTADAQGRFSLSDVPVGTRQVQARLLGYGAVTQTVTVAEGQTATVNFELVRKAVQLEGIVTTGYGTQERSRVVGAISSVQSTQIAEIPTHDPIKAIQGRVPGVEIVAASNLPGAEMNMRIRGIRSISATNEPLIVLDGVPIAGGIADFSATNIESIEVLKDAAATAIYGTRGANGVVLITSKSGSTGTRTRFSSNLYYGQQKAIRLADMMNMQEFVAMMKAAGVYMNFADTTVNGVLPYPEQRAAYAAGQFTDWQRAVLRTGAQRNYDMGMNGVSGNTRFALAGSLFDQDGLTLGQAYQRTNGMASVDHTLGRLRLGVTANATRSKQETGSGDGLWGVALAQTGFGLPYDASGGLITRPDGEPLSVNPLRMQQLDIGQTTRNRVFGSLFSDLQIAPGVNWRVNFGPDITFFNVGRFQAPEVTPPTTVTFSRGSLRQQENFAYTLDNILQLTRDLGTSHHFDATLLHSVAKSRTTVDSLSARNMPSSASLWYALQTGQIEGQQSNLSEIANESVMGRLNYTFLDRYTLSAAMRRDGGSVFAKGHKWADFPSVGLAWRMSEESFMRRFDFVSSAKVRGSYGVTGNTGINAYQSQGALLRAPYNFGAVSGIGFGPNQGNPENPNLTWEKTYQADVGAELGFLGDRITTVIDWYRQNTKDLLLTRVLPATTGYTSTLQNIGETLNNGLELQLSTLNVRNWHGISWNTDINWAHNHNEIVKLATSDTTGCPINARPCDLNNRWFIGQPINIGATANTPCTDRQRCVWYDYKFDGIWQYADTALARSMGQCAATTAITACPFKPGEIRLVDVNGDGRITPGGDQVILGNTFPKWTASVYNRVTWKNFDASALATIKWDYTIFDSFGQGGNQMQGRFGALDLPYWTKENQSNVAPAPRLSGNPVPYNATRFYRDGSHWRIRNISVGYTVPQQYLNRLRLNAGEARLYAIAQEPKVFTDYKGPDPENGTTAGAPAVRTLLVGINLGF
ncbi:MAG TPA: SusC/RagA family TonB-linked outer membrane protein [Gemmatimonadaceae bacterium]|nr:SusC/RagA family TonB-linked outer membrane protein [Gemmatimonadaceae bacterium]